MIEPLKSSYIFKQKYGFLGEFYYHMNKFESVDNEILLKYFSLKKPYYCNRNMYYYNTQIEQLVNRLPNYINDYDNCYKTIKDEEIRRDILYSILSHETNDLSKIIGIVYSRKGLRQKYFVQLKELIQEKCDALVNIMFSDDIQIKLEDDADLCGDLLKEISNIDGLSIREYSEMDHPILLIKSFFAYKAFVEDKHLFLGPLQGACMIPPFYISMLKKFTQNLDQAKWDFNYVRHSNYDNTHYLDLPLDEQINILSKQYTSDIPLLLIDDTTGTATTIKAIKKHLKKSFSDITTAVIECRWDTKIYNEEYPAFGMNDVDIISPLEYRHYRNFAEEIHYIKTKSDLSDKYKNNGFYKEQYIHKKMNFRRYIESSDIKPENKKKLEMIIENYDLISMDII